MADWNSRPPPPAPRQPLTLDLPRVIDHTCLQKYLTIKDAKGQAVAGVITVGKDEKAWSFVPQNPWQAEEHRLHVDPRLEDVAGNTPIRAFDVDLKAPLPEPQSLEIKFRPR